MTAIPGQSAAFPAAPKPGASRRAWLVAYLVAFLALEGLLVGVFLVLGQGSRLRTQMEREADVLLAEGRGADALAVAREIGDRWPDQRGTFAFERRLGQCFEAAGDHDEAALHLDMAIDAAPDAWDIRAEAGRALWKAGERERAAQRLREELEQGNPDNDVARVHLALIALDEGKTVEAFKRFQGIAKREALPDEAKAAIAQAEADIAGPARAEALRRLQQDHPLPPSSGS